MKLTLTLKDTDGAILRLYDKVVAATRFEGTGTPDGVWREAAYQARAEHDDLKARLAASEARVVELTTERDKAKKLARGSAAARNSVPVLCDKVEALTVERVAAVRRAEAAEKRVAELEALKLT